MEKHVVRIQILSFEGCPNREDAISRVREAVAQQALAAEVSVIEIRSAQEAIDRRFLGSPTVLIDGVDVEPDARARTEYGLMCRTYRSDEGLAGAPPLALIAQALEERTTHRSLSDAR